MRGIASIANAVAPVCAIACTPSPSVSGARKPTRTCSAFRFGAGPGATRAMTWAPQGSPICAPALANSSSGIPAASPAPASITTSWPAPASRRTTSGTSATRRSPAALSLGTPILIGCETVYETRSHERRHQRGDGRHAGGRGERSRRSGGRRRADRRQRLDLDLLRRLRGRRRRRRGRRGGSRRVALPRHLGERERLARKRRYRLGCDPYRRLLAGTRV